MRSAAKQLGWGLAFKLARREMRHRIHDGPDGRIFAGFRIFLLCLILGVFTIAAVGSLSASLVGGMAAQGQAILGGDMDFRLTHRAAFETERSFLQSQLTSPADISEIATMRAMARIAGPADALPQDMSLREAMLVEAKAVDAAYPLYGTLRFDRDILLAEALAVIDTPRGPVFGAVAEQGLFDRLDIQPGTELVIGDARMRLMAVLTGEPDRNAGGFPLAPRLMVSHEALDAAGLLRPGALVNYHYRLRLPDSADNAAVKALRARAEAAFPLAGWRMRDRSDASPSMRRFIERLGLFLTLVGLTALVVGGVGVGNAITAYLQSRRETIAIIKALGGSGRFISRIYALQILALSLVALLIGLTLGALVPYLVQFFVGALLPVRLALGLYAIPLLAAGGFGLFAAAAFALWPLGRVETTPVTSLFRADTQNVGRPAARYIWAIGFCFMGLGLLAMLISERRDVALWFALGVGLSYLALRGAAALLVFMAKRVGRPRQPELRMALANMTRPNAPVRAVMLSIGLSVTLLSAISMVDGNINRQISGDLPSRTPSFFLLDVAPNQLEALLDTMRADEAISQIETAPMLRGQILSIKGVPSAEVKAAPDSAWVLSGDRGLTYASTPPQGGALVEGAWWPSDYSGPPLVSFDVDQARGLGLSVGDEIEVNVLGRPLTARLANTRIVDWASGGMNFVMVFSPNPLASAPHTHLASMVVDEAAEARFARLLARDYPNVTIIRVKEALAAMRDVLTNLGLAVRAMSAITLLAGILVLAGAMAAGHKARVYDAVVMKVLGATRARILAAFALEYALMGLGAAIIAAATGTLAAFALIVGPMQADFIFLPSTLAATVFGAVALTVVLGLLGTYSALSAPAAPVLRSE
jgi:putative ABC transport system permease protein